MTIDYKGIGKRIKAARNKRNVTQEALADAIGVTVNHVSNIETGNTKLSLQVLIHIANFLAVTTDQLLCDNIQKCKIVFSAEIEDTLSDCSDIEVKLLSDILRSSKAAIRNNMEFVERLKVQSVKEE